jgi:hypothetical protein
MARLLSLRARRIRTAIVVLLVAVSTAGGLLAMAYSVGRGVAPELRFLREQKPLADGAAICACQIDYALHSHEVNDVVFIGDSAGHDGIDPILFEKVSRHRAYNLCSERGLGPMGYLITIKAYLLNHPRPQVVVLCITPICFEADARTFGGDLPEQFATHYSPEVGLTTAPERVAYFARCGALSFVQSSRSDARDLPLEFLPSETYTTLRRRLSESRGFSRLDGQHGPPGALDRRGEPVRVHAEWNYGVRRIAELCQSQNVPLFIRFAPLAEDDRGLREWGPLLDWCETIQHDYPSVTVVNPAMQFFDRALLWDSLHLNAEGAAHFTERLGRYLRAGSPSSRFTRPTYNGSTAKESASDPRQP